MTLIQMYKTYIDIDKLLLRNKHSTATLSGSSVTPYKSCFRLSLKLRHLDFPSKLLDQEKLGNMIHFKELA